MTYRWAEHTAEVELEIEAPTEEAVFTAALHALAELLGDGARGDRVSCAVAVTGPERAVLLAQWLDELVVPSRDRGSRPRGGGAHRAQRRRSDPSAELRHKLEAQGIAVRCPSNRGLAEEAPLAYKDVERVVAVVERAGLAARVAQLMPLGVIKG